MRPSIRQIGRRRATILAVALAGDAALGVSRASPLFAQPARWLIGPDERQASRAEEERLKKNRIYRVEVMPDDPAIQIVLPVAGHRIVSPVDFDVRFSTKPPAAIEPTSIKLLYGFLGIDITKRFREFGGDITAAGIALNKAPLQPDNYLVTIQVANTAKVTVRKSVRFTVE